MLGAGQRSSRVRFERRVTVSDDGFGNEREGWDAVATCWAAFRPRFGREQIEAGRLESSMQGTLTTLRFAATEGVTAADRVVFVAGPYRGKTAGILSIVPTPDNREIEFMLEEREGMR